jgi:hypothetical protein
VRSLSNGAIVSESLATLNAIDDPSSLAITAAGADGAEGDTGLKGLRFTVARSGNLSVETVVDFVVSGAGTYPINAQDFGGLLPAGTLTFSAGEASKSITIQVRGDTSPEFDESFAVTLSNPTGGGILVVPSAIGTIRNDDKLATNSDSFWLTQGQQASLDVQTTTRPAIHSDQRRFSFATVHRMHQLQFHPTGKLFGHPMQLTLAPIHSRIV